MKKSLKSILGVTLLEIMLVLAIAAMIIMMSIRYYQSATSSEQANNVLQQIQGITAAADQLAQGSTGYNAVNTADVASLMGVEQINFKTVWGQLIDVATGGPTSYTVTIPAMPSAVCLIVKPKLTTNVRYTNISDCASAGSNADFTYTYDATK